ncbi:MAG TPA: Mov34/MPN/PAD-1 family protein [Phycisphaerae bacterium]|nr:Mov34/MPN/PAD-1 family protein [Phycisphaerae bacterium]
MNRNANIITTPSIARAGDDLVQLITPERLEAIYRQAEATYPRECCGMILASGALRPCENAQDKLHRLDPNEFPRTALNGYCFEVEDQLFLCRSLESKDPVRIVYHSHPNAPPDFSETDRRGAEHGGGATYPELGFLVVQIGSDHVRAARCYAFIEGCFRERASWP